MANVANLHTRADRAFFRAPFHITRKYQMLASWEAYFSAESPERKKVAQELNDLEDQIIANSK